MEAAKTSKENNVKSNEEFAALQLAITEFITPQPGYTGFHNANDFRGVADSVNKSGNIAVTEHAKIEEVAQKRYMNLQKTQFLNVQTIRAEHFVETMKEMGAKSNEVALFENYVNSLSERANALSNPVTIVEDLTKLGSEFARRCTQIQNSLQNAKIIREVELAQFQAAKEAEELFKETEQENAKIVREAELAQFQAVKDASAFEKAATEKEESLSSLKQKYEHAKTQIESLSFEEKDKANLVLALQRGYNIARSTIFNANGLEQVESRSESAHNAFSQAAKKYLEIAINDAKYFALKEIDLHSEFVDSAMPEAFRKTGNYENIVEAQMEARMVIESLKVDNVREFNLKINEQFIKINQAVISSENDIEREKARLERIEREKTILESIEREKAQAEGFLSYNGFHNPNAEQDVED